LHVTGLNKDKLYLPRLQFHVTKFDFYVTSNLSVKEETEPNIGIKLYLKQLSPTQRDSLTQPKTQLSHGKHYEW